MAAPSFSPVRKNEQARVFATLVSAFAGDPVERWLYPESQQYLTHFPEFLAAFGGKAFDEQTVWSLGDYFAVALWLPRAQSQTATPSPPYSPRPSRRNSMRTRLRSSSRWT